MLCTNCVFTRVLLFAFDSQGIVVLVVTDDEEAVRSRLADMGQDSLAAGVVAITGPRGYGTTRILTELQQAWLLGYGDVSIVSPVSVVCVSCHPFPTADSCRCNASTNISYYIRYTYARFTGVPTLFLNYGAIRCSCQAKTSLFSNGIIVACSAGFGNWRTGACTNERFADCGRGQLYCPPIHVFATLPS